jgi:YD repeat-containing protein
LLTDVPNMSTKHFPKFLLIVNFALSILLVNASPASSDQINYSYDDAGRLIKVQNDSESVLYQYDEVGNLLSIIKENSTGQALAPVLQNIDPDIFVIGQDYYVTLTGQNLLTTSGMTSDNPGVTVKFVAALDSMITATLSLAAGTSPGPANLTVTTSYGSATMPINLYKVNMTPTALLLFLGSSPTMTVSLTPSSPKDVTAEIDDQNPDIINAQPSVTIPAGTNANFQITTIKTGTGVLKVGDAEATAVVIGDSISSPPVNVSLGAI